MPNFKFLASTNAEIWRGPKIPQNDHVTPWWTLFTQIFIFTIGHLTVILHANFRISSFSRCWDMEGVPKFPKMVTWLPGNHFLPKFSFLALGHLTVILHAKFPNSSISRCRDMERSQSSPKWSVTPGNRFWPKFSFFYDRAPRNHSACQISNF